MGINFEGEMKRREQEIRDKETRDKEVPENIEEEEGG